MAAREKLPLGLLIAVLVLVIGLGLWGVSWTGDVPDTMDDSQCERILNDPESVDAIEWLKTPSAGRKKPGSMTIDEALSLALNLQRLGATRITADRLELARSKETVADKVETSRGTVFQLPPDPRSRIELFRFYAKLMSKAGRTPRGDTGQKYLFVPWTQDETSSDLD